MRSLTSFSMSATCCGRERGAVEIEGQFVRADEGALLRGFLADDFVQRPVEQVRDGVMALDGVAASRGRHCSVTCIADCRASVFAFNEMQPSVAGLLRVRNAPALVTVASAIRPCHQLVRPSRHRTEIDSATTAVLSFSRTTSRTFVLWRHACRNRQILWASSFRFAESEMTSFFCAARARAFCSSINLSKPSLSTVKPRSRAINSVRSSGKP